LCEILTIECDAESALSSNRDTRDAIRWLMDDRINAVCANALWGGKSLMMSSRRSR